MRFLSTPRGELLLTPQEGVEPLVFHYQMLSARTPAFSCTVQRISFPGMAEMGSDVYVCLEPMGSATSLRLEDIWCGRGILKVPMNLLDPEPNLTRNPETSEKITTSKKTRFSTFRRTGSPAVGFPSHTGPTGTDTHPAVTADIGSWTLARR